MAGISEEQAEDFCTRLNTFRATLSEEQQPLLDAILKIAWRVGVKEEDLSEGFDGCFTPAQADLIVEYGAPTGTPEFIIRGHILSASGLSIIRG